MKPAEYATWVLICNGSQARLFGVPDGHRRWSMLQAFIHPASRLKGEDLVTDRPGRTQSVGMPGSDAAKEPRTPPKELEVMEFVRELAQALEHGRTEKKFDKLVLAAPPHVLGLLREQLNPNAARMVSFSVDKDYTHLPEDQLPLRFLDLAQAAGAEPGSVVL